MPKGDGALPEIALDRSLYQLWLNEHAPAQLGEPGGLTYYLAFYNHQYKLHKKQARKWLVIALLFALAAAADLAAIVWGFFND